MRLEGLQLITPECFFDDRGFFFESFSPKMEAELKTSFVQDNHSFSKKHVLRGMHLQKGQAKLVRVTSGEIFDVAVDMREGSNTYLQWEGVRLTAEGREILFIPDGFAHGFLVLSESAHVLYKVSAPYDPKLERGFRYDDPRFNIQWPDCNPILSKRDQTPLHHN